MQKVKIKNLHSENKNRLEKYLILISKKIQAFSLKQKPASMLDMETVALRRSRLGANLSWVAGLAW